MSTELEKLIATWRATADIWESQHHPTSKVPQPPSRGSALISNWINWLRSCANDAEAAAVKDRRAGHDDEATGLSCAFCGGPHQFDTSVPSVVWNERIRRDGLPDFLCASCILRAFAHHGQSFTATLYGDDLHGVPIEVQVDSVEAVDAQHIQDENNALRRRLAELEAVNCASEERRP